MDRIGVRELRQNASRYLDRVKAGQTIEVTERGRLIALLVPPSPSTQARERLIREGRLKPATGPHRLPPRVRADTDSGSVLDDLRSER